VVGWWVGLLSLIPCLIKHVGAVVVSGCGCGWVEHNTAAGLNVESLARCWVLRRHLLGCCSLVPLLAWAV
jgi:hypothetical protein